jgi:endonuclease YncB( thermonuclease family)
MMRRRVSKRPPRPLRWNPPPNVRRARRNRRNAFAAAAVLLVAGGATALSYHRSLVGELGSSKRASAPAEPIGRASLTRDGDEREASPALRHDTQPDTSPRDRFKCTVTFVIDGDTFRCAETDATGREIRVRVSGIDAREKDGTCAPGHPCASAPPEAAAAALASLIGGQILSCRPVGETYERVAAWCNRADGTDVSCAMMASGTVARWWKYWGLHRC